jgi:transcriptional regulator with XRE-family HTH domain
MPRTTTNPPPVHTRLPLGADGARELGATLRAARLSGDMRLDDLAALSGVHRSQISRIERGVALTLTPTARRLCECLGVPLPVGRQQHGLAEFTARVGALLRTHPLARKDIHKALETIEKRYAGRAQLATNRR